MSEIYTIFTLKHPDSSNLWALLGNGVLSAAELTSEDSVVDGITGNVVTDYGFTRIGQVASLTPKSDELTLLTPNVIPHPQYRLAEQTGTIFDFFLNQTSY